VARKNAVVYGIYPNRLAVETAVTTLKQRGFRNSDVSVLFSDGVGTRAFAHQKGTKAPEGTAVGASTGALLGGALGWLAGIGILSLPVLGPFVAAGPIMGLLAGAGVGGSVGGIAGALVGIGIPEYEARRFEGFVKQGGILLSVHCDQSEWVLKAKELLKHTGARDIASSVEAASDEDTGHQIRSNHGAF
jgi:hypothetical protein